MPIRTPNQFGESIEELHDRIAQTLHRIVTDLDTDPAQPKTLLICTHAAGMIAIGRVLTGRMPEDPDTPDFHCFTASFSRFNRRTFELSNRNVAAEHGTLDQHAKVNWRNYGIKGYWECKENSNTDFLSKGPERGW